MRTRSPRIWSRASAATSSCRCPSQSRSISSCAQASAQARLFLEALDAGEHAIAFLAAGLLQRAVEIDAGFADLDLGTRAVVEVLSL